jgi:hypothetical protein
MGIGFAERGILPARREIESHCGFYVASGAAQREHRSRVLRSKGKP